MNYLRGFSLNAVCTGLTFSLGLVNHWLLANHLLDKAAYGRLTLWTSAAMIGAIVLGEWLRRGDTIVVGKEGVGAEARDNALIYCTGIFVVALGIAYVGSGIGFELLGQEALDYWPLLAALPVTNRITGCSPGSRPAVARLTWWPTEPPLDVPEIGSTLSQLTEPWTG